MSRHYNKKQQDLLYLQRRQHFYSPVRFAFPPLTRAQLSVSLVLHLE